MEKIIFFPVAFTSTAQKSVTDCLHNRTKFTDSHPAARALWDEITFSLCFTILLTDPRAVGSLVSWALRAMAIPSLMVILNFQAWQYKIILLKILLPPWKLLFRSPLPQISTWYKSNTPAWPEMAPRCILGNLVRIFHFIRSSIVHQHDRNWVTQVKC